MLGMKTYRQNHIDACRARVDAGLRTYRKQVGTTAVKEFAHRVFNDQLLPLDYMFGHRRAGVETGSIWPGPISCDSPSRFSPSWRRSTGEARGAMS